MPEYDPAQYGNTDRQAKIINIRARLDQLDIEREKAKERRRAVIGNLDSEVSAAAAIREKELLREVAAVVESATSELDALLADVRECRRGTQIPTWNAELRPTDVVAAVIAGRSLVHPDRELGGADWVPTR